jgi:hypothetical protein
VQLGPFHLFGHRNGTSGQSPGRSPARFIPRRRPFWQRYSWRLRLGRWLLGTLAIGIMSRVRRARPRPTETWLSPRALLLGALLGAGLLYLFDPDRGRRRRSAARDRGLALVRNGLCTLGRFSRRFSAQLYGLARRAMHLTQETPRERVTPNDPTLAQRIKSQLYRDPAVPRDRLSINVEGGRVVLRGEVDDTSQIEKIARAVCNVPGVTDILNLLHAARSGQQPTQQSSQESSQQPA